MNRFLVTGGDEKPRSGIEVAHIGEVALELAQYRDGVRALIDRPQRERILRPKHGV